MAATEEAGTAPAAGQSGKPGSSSATEKLVRIGLLYLVPMALKAVVELRVPTILAKAGPGAFLSPREIAAHIPNSTAITADTVGRFLRLLTAHGVFEESLKQCHSGEGIVERKFALNEVSSLIVDDEEGALLTSAVLFLTDKVLVECGYSLGESAVDGTQPFVKAHGVDVWTYFSNHARINTLFNQTMTNWTSIVMADIVKNYAGFSSLKGTLVDVAGGYGAAVSTIVKAHPHITGINFDQPHIVAQAPISPGVEHIAGDMFESIPDGDAIFLKSTMHDWDDEACVKILRNAHKALPAHGRVILVETALAEETNRDEATQAQLHMDICMLSLAMSGRVRTEAEYRKLVRDAGFSRLELAYTRDANFSVLEAFV